MIVEAIVTLGRSEVSCYPMDCHPFAMMRDSTPVLDQPQAVSMQRVALFRMVSTDRDPEPSIRLARCADGAVIEVDAASLLAQYSFDDGDVLLVLDEDTPYEEQLHLVLVRGVAVVDHLVIGAPYANGIFRELEVSGDCLAFRFEGEAVWSVGLDDRGSRIPTVLPSGARRRGGWLARHYLLLTRRNTA